LKQALQFLPVSRFSIGLFVTIIIIYLLRHWGSTVKYKRTEHIKIMHDKDLQKYYNYALNDAIIACVTLSV